MNPSNVLFVHSSNDLYGADRILLELLKGLDRNRFSPIVALPSDAKHINGLSTRLEEAKIEYFFVRMAVLRRKYFSLFGIVTYAANLLIGMLNLARLIRKRQIALVHSNTLAVPCGALSAAILKTPHIWHVHEIITEPILVRKVVHSMACRLSDAVVTVSNAVREHILIDCPRHSSLVKVIYNGIDMTRFTNGALRINIREELGIPLDAVLIGMIGRVNRWKGQVIFAEAARLTLLTRPDIYFLAVGGVFDQETIHMERFKAAVNDAGLQKHFIISDFRSDIATILHSLDGFVLPSCLPDPFPTVVLEAMAAERPVIATAHGGASEMVIDGETGYLVPPNDALELAKAIIVLSLNLKEANKMGEAGRQRVKERFQAVRFISEFQELYKETLRHDEGLPALKE